MWLFLLFVSIPLIEIALFIQIGGLIGLWPTLGIVILTALFGTWLVRDQGLKAIQDLRQSFSKLDDPSEPLAHGAMILFAGALLLTPGFFTDTVGFLLLLPPFRRAVFGYLRRRVTVHRFQMGQSPRDGRPPMPPDTEKTIDGDWKEVEPQKRPTHESSGWTKH